MSRRVRRLVNLFQSGKIPGEFSRRELVVILKELGYEVSRTKRHFKASHPRLVDNQRFQGGVMSVCDHAHSTPETIHFKGMQDVSNALRTTHPELFS